MYFYHLKPWQSWQVVPSSHSYECQSIQTKHPFDKILSLSFDLRPLKVNTYCIKKNQFCKGHSYVFSKITLLLVLSHLHPITYLISTYLPKKQCCLKKIC